MRYFPVLSNTTPDHYNSSTNSNRILEYTGQISLVHWNEEISHRASRGANHRAKRQISSTSSIIPLRLRYENSITSPRHSKQPREVTVLETSHYYAHSRVTSALLQPTREYLVRARWSVTRDRSVVTLTTEDSTEVEVELTRTIKISEMWSLQTHWFRFGDRVTLLS